LGHGTTKKRGTFAPFLPLKVEQVARYRLGSDGNAGQEWDRVNVNRQFELSNYHQGQNNGDDNRCCQQETNMAVGSEGRVVWSAEIGHKMCGGGYHVEGGRGRM